MGGIVIVDSVSGGTTDGANKDLSNLTVTGEAKFKAPSLISSDAGNGLTSGTDNKLYIDVDVSSKANTDLDNITTAGTSVITSLISSNITGKANTNLMNTNFITNAILSAPNGVATYSGLQLQLPAETVLACPDGINADGTRKSIVVTTASLLTITTTASDGPFKLVYRQSNNTLAIIRVNTTFYYEQPTTPTGMSSGALWYNNSPSVNKCYMYNGSAWVEDPFVVLADFSYTGGAISNFNARYPVELLKVSDTDAILDKIFVGKNYINNIVNLTITTTAQLYTLPDNGYITIGTNNDTDMCYVSINGGQSIITIGRRAGTVARYISPILKKGTVVVFQAGESSIVLSYARFVPAINS